MPSISSFHNSWCQLSHESVTMSSIILKKSGHIYNHHCYFLHLVDFSWPPPLLSVTSNFSHWSLKASFTKNWYFCFGRVRSKLNNMPSLCILWKRRERWHCGLFCRVPEIYQKTVDEPTIQYQFKFSNQFSLDLACNVSELLWSCFPPHIHTFSYWPTIHMCIFIASSDYFFTCKLKHAMLY